MGDTTYQVFFTNDDGGTEYLEENFYSEKKAKKAAERLVEEGYDDAQYESIAVELGDY